MPFRHTVIAVSIGAGAALVLGSGVALYGAHREVAGVTKERARAEAAQRAMTEAYQLEKDRADAQYRGAVLAREAAKIGLAAARAELDRVLRAAGRDPANPRAGRRPDEAGPDWIGGLAGIYQGRARGHALDRVRTLRQPEPVRVFCPPGLLAPEGNTHQAGVAGVGLDRVVAVLGGDGRRLAE